jgi:hypothetical protein
MTSRSCPERLPRRGRLAAAIRLAAVASLTALTTQVAGCSYAPQAQDIPATNGPAQGLPAQKAPPKTPSKPPSKEDVLKAVVQLQKDAKNAPIPSSVIELPTPDGWTKAKPKPLPPTDHGFTIAYDHATGPMVTLYQYTRGLTTIGDEVPSPALDEELRRAKDGIEQAVQFGVWQSAKEKSSGIVSLGDSKQKALWSQHELAVNDETVISDTYVWACGNAFLKMRATGRPGQKPGVPDPLRSLLTALGDAKLAAR